MARVRVVFFDVDGVLLDSLPEHLNFCAAKAKEYGLPDLPIPSVDDFKKQIRSGVRVSPMLHFFLALNFPRGSAEKGVRDYEREFMAHFPPKPFPQVEETLQRLEGAGLVLGLITSNVRANVEPALGGSVMRHFDPRCVFFADSDGGSSNKTAWLLKGALAMGVAPADCLYVGDQPADAAAAQLAGARFLGVSYGWGFAANDSQAGTVDSVQAIADAVVAAAVSRDTPVSSLDDLSDKEKLRLDYAWNWFNFHADQRTKMFNYMFLGLGIFATALATALKEKLYWESAAASLMAAVIAIAFRQIDKRNIQLYQIGSDVLIDIEKQSLFADKPTVRDRSDKRDVDYGLARRQASEDRPKPNWMRSFIEGRHRTLMPFVTWAFAGLFLIAAVWSGYKALYPGSDNTQTSVQMICCWDGTTTSGSVVRSARFTGFGEGSDAVNCEDPANAAAVEAVDTGIATIAGRDMKAVLLLVGGTDRTPLSPGLRQRFESNAGLSRARVTAVEKCLHLPSESADTADKRIEVIRVVSGPSYAPATADTRDVAVKRLADDREVRVLVLGVPVTRAGNAQ